MTNTIRTKERAEAFTLIEMLVVVSMFGLIMGVIATLFAKGTQVYRHGETHIELQRSGRHLASRLTPYLVTAYDAYRPSIDPIVCPAGVNPDFPENPADRVRVVRFYTTEDWLHADYDDRTDIGRLGNDQAPLMPPTISSVSALSTADFTQYLYEIGLDEEEDVVLRRLGAFIPEAMLPTRLEDPNHPIYDASVESTPTSEHRPQGDTRALYRMKNRNTDNPETFLDADGNSTFEFLYPRRYLLLLRYRISKNTRGANNQLMRINEPFRITFNLPSKLI